MASNMAACPKERTSANPGVDLGPIATVLENPGVAEKLLQGLVLPIDQVELDKLNLDRAIMRFFHYVGQVTMSFTSISYFCIFVVLTNSIFTSNDDWIFLGRPQQGDARCCYSCQGQHRIYLRRDGPSTRRG